MRLTKRKRQNKRDLKDVIYPTKKTKANNKDSKVLLNIDHNQSGKIVKIEIPRI